MKQGEPLFDMTLSARQNMRAGRRREGIPFLWQRAAEDLSERRLDIARVLHKALFIGPKALYTEWIKILPAEKRPRHIDHISAYDVGATALAPKSYDMVISAFRLHRDNDPLFVLRQLNLTLKPDGVFIGCFFGGESLKSLRRAFYGFDTQKFGAPLPRLHPMINHEQAGGLLGASGFALPVVDIDRVEVSYGRLQTLMHDLRDMGEGNALRARHKTYPGRHFLSRLSGHYDERREDGKFHARFDILWITGWRADPSQPKPLKPGSAQVSLTQVLGDQK